MNSNEIIIADYLVKSIGNEFGAFGLMGNIRAESACSSINLQNSCERRLGINDMQYTKSVDNDSYTDFVNDSAGYGLCQWTSSSRKNNLLNYAKKTGKSIGDLHMQLEFLMIELNGSYKSVLRSLRSAKSIREASDIVLTKFERPRNQNESVKVSRAKYGQSYYDEWKSMNSNYNNSIEDKNESDSSLNDIKISVAKSFDKSIKGTYVTTGKLRLRNAPGTKGTKVIRIMDKGTKVINYGYYTKVDNTNWLLVKVNDSNDLGFCSSTYLSKVK